MFLTVLLVDIDLYPCNALDFRKLFLSCVKIELNGVAPVMAKLATVYNSVLCCNKSSLLRIVWIAWKKDIVSCDA